MDKKAIRELYKGIEEDLSVELTNNKKYKEIVNRRRNKEEVIRTDLSNSEFELIQEYIEIENEASAVEMEEAFVKGFSIAYLLLIDSLR